MFRGLRVAFAGVTIACWALLLLNVSPLVELPDDVQRLLMTVAGCGLVIIAVRASSRPVQEVYEMGFEAGRRAGRVEGAVYDATQNVVPFRRRA